MSFPLKAGNDGRSTLIPWRLKGIGVLPIVFGLVMIEAKATGFLENRLKGRLRVSLQKALNASTTHRYDYLNTCVNDLANVVDREVIREAKISLGVDPLGGAGVHYWEPIAARYGLNLTVVNKAVDPTFRFMTEAPATPEQKAVLAKLATEQIDTKDLTSEKIEAILTYAPRNGAPIGGLKTSTRSMRTASREPIT